MKKLILFMVLISCFLGCGLNDYEDCHGCMDECIAAYGPPEEVIKYDDSDGFHSWDYWYWCQGFCITFTWGNDFDCETSTYTFSPICY